jgi:hypothetical protein
MLPYDTRVQLRVWALDTIGATLVEAHHRRADHTPDLGPLAIVWKDGRRQALPFVGAR